MIHIVEEHIYKCPMAPKPCRICSGSLRYCFKCQGVANGDDSCLPTDCPERPLTAVEKEDVRYGGRDYRDGRWVCIERGVA